MEEEVFHNAERAYAWMQRIPLCGVKWNKLNLIHGTPEDSQGDAGFSECEAELIVTGMIAAGTIIRIGNQTKELEKDLDNQKFHIHPMFKAIVATSL